MAYGQSVTLTATVTNNDATTTPTEAAAVNFYDGTNILGAVRHSPVARPCLTTVRQLLAWPRTKSTSSTYKAQGTSHRRHVDRRGNYGWFAAGGSPPRRSRTRRAARSAMARR